jgi:hypothetical protein
VRSARNAACATLATAAIVSLCMDARSAGGSVLAPHAEEVQCQRTRCYLPFVIAEGEMASCPWCPDHETYERVASSRFPSKLVNKAIRMARSEFKVAEDALGTAVWIGEGPECVLEPHLNRCNIYLGRKSKPLQIMYSGGHEAFHRVCSPSVGSHWADEMFAVLFSLLYLDSIGQGEHADVNRRDLVAEADLCTIETMFKLDGGSCPPGLYGRVYLLGQSLIERIGWGCLKLLAVTKDPDGRMDLTAWLSSLTTDERRKVLPLLAV